MLKHYQCNRLEALAALLRVNLAKAGGDVFMPGLVVVSNPGMGRWLLHRLADASGVVANVEMPLPATFFWRHVMGAWLPEADSSAFNRDTIAWRILGILPTLIEQPVFSPLCRYLRDDESGLRRFQLAVRIADVFDQYLVFRPEMVLAWEAGQEDLPPLGDMAWQRSLWRALATPGTSHRAGLMEDLLAAMEESPRDDDLLPDTMHLFGLNALPPVYFEITRSLAQHRDVCVYHLNPCQEYWADIRSDRSLAHHADPQAAFLEVGNPLLASFGHVGQVFLDQLLSLEGEISEHFFAPEGSGILQRLQKDILTLTDGRASPQQFPVSDWPSLQFHGAHTRLREVQLLHDNLLRCFEAFDGLTPRDVLVMAPDMAAYAPFVEAVFTAADDHRRIPYSIGDRSIGGENPLGEALRWLLQLPQSRFTASEILALLEVDALRRRFGLDAEAVARIRAWARETGIRWGADAAHRADLGLPGDNDLHSWRFGLRRLFLGYASPANDTERLYADVAPYLDIEGSELLWAGALQSLLDRLDQWRRKLSAEMPVDAWRQKFLDLLDAFFDASDDEERDLLQSVRNQLQGLVEQTAQVDFSAPVSLAVMRELLEQSLEDTTPARGFLDGGVTFSNLLPMRALPFRVICLLGMNDSDFPRRQKPPSFDLMEREPQRSDRDRRRDDRYLFLETLLSARDCLLISWQSRDVRSDKPRLPAEVVSELRDYLDDACRVGAGEPKPSEQLFVQHPLQPFSPRYFSGDEPRLFSYDDSWAAAKAGAKKHTAFMDGDVIPSAEPRTISLDELLHFFNNPATVFLEQTLAMRLPGSADLLEDSEPFSLDALDEWVIGNRLVRAMLSAQTPESAAKRLQAEGGFPHGQPGRLRAEILCNRAQSLTKRLKPWLQQYPWRDEPLSLDLMLAGTRLTGTIRGCTNTGVLDFRVGKLRPQDRLGLWIRHLAVASHRGEACNSYFIAEDKVLCLKPMAGKDARRLLTCLVACYLQGLHAPLKFYPRSSWAFAKDNKGWENTWYGGFNRSGEDEDPAYQLVFTHDDPLDEQFEQIAHQVFGPLIATMEEIE